MRPLSSVPVVGRFLRLAAPGLIASTAVAVALVGTAGPALAAAPSAQDITYMTANAQTSLAEIALGNLTLSKSQNAGVRDLATTTLEDHTAALAKATAAMQSLGIPVPTEPSAEQKATAATLGALSGSAYDLQYAQAQVAGHNKSVASTNTEITTGTEPAVKTYATEYLPVAAMHLSMSQDLVTALGAAPTAVPAGNGGMVAADQQGTNVRGLVLLVLGAVLIVGAISFLVRRRYASSAR